MEQQLKFHNLNHRNLLDQRDHIYQTRTFHPHQIDKSKLIDLIV